MILVTKTSIRLDRGDTLSLLVQLYNSYVSPKYLVLSLLLPCCSLYYLGWQLLNQPFLFYIFSLSTHVSPVSRTASTII